MQVCPANPLPDNRPINLKQSDSASGILSRNVCTFRGRIPFRLRLLHNVLMPLRNLFHSILSLLISSVTSHHLGSIAPQDNYTFSGVVL
jgi:hypothetical protein